MRIVADTNVLVRAIVADDAKQARLAQSALADADLVAIPTVALCELAWVLSSNYKIMRDDIGEAIRTLIAATNVQADRPPIEAGLAMLARGGDFADGVIAFEGATLGAETFASFDKDAVKRLRAEGVSSTLLG
jgi:predicted nucleic-acid-binding protein